MSVQSIVAMGLESKEARKGRIMKKPEETFGTDRYVYHLD